MSEVDLGTCWQFGYCACIASLVLLSVAFGWYSQRRIRAGLYEPRLVEAG